MATLHPVIVPAKVIKGGRHKVRISVSHNGATRYMVTSIIIDSEKEFKNGCIVKRADAANLNTKLRRILQTLQDAIDDIEHINAISCSELIFLLKNGNAKERYTLNSLFEEYVSVARITESTKSTYRTYWNLLSRSFNTEMLAEHLTFQAILSIDKELFKRGLSQSSVASAMTLLRIVINHGLKNGYFTYKRDPFANYRKPKTTVRDSWLSVEEIKRIRDFETDNRVTRRARDIFMLSYYLGGINIVDLIAINFNENVDTIRYKRTKIASRLEGNRCVEFAIPQEAKEIIERYKGDDGFLRISRSSNYKARVSGNLINEGLVKIEKALGTKHLIYYSARKSFAQHASDLGIGDSVIDYLLGHKDRSGSSCLYAYRQISVKRANESLRMVLDNLK